MLNPNVGWLNEQYRYLFFSIVVGEVSSSPKDHGNPSFLMFFSFLPWFSSLHLPKSMRESCDFPRTPSKEHGPKLAEVCMRQAARLEELQAELEKAPAIGTWYHPGLGWDLVYLWFISALYLVWLFSLSLYLVYWCLLMFIDCHSPQIW